MRRQLDGVVRLARYKEYIFFVTVTTFLGAAAGHGVFGWRLLGVLVANWLAVGFAFMFNDVEDAPEDALNPAKVRRNPVSAGDLSPRVARWISFAVAVAAGVLYSLLGIWPFVTGLSCLVIAHLYSWRMVRLKTVPVLDLVSHCLMLAGLQFLPAYLSFVESPDGQWVFPFIFIVAISLYGELFNEMRDLEGDTLAGLKHSASVLGPRATQWVMYFLLAVALVSGVVTVVWVGLIPNWVLLVLAVLEFIFLVPAARRAWSQHSALDVQSPFHMPLQHAGALAVLIWFLAPWMYALPWVQALWLRLMQLRPF